MTNYQKVLGKIPSCILLSIPDLTTAVDIILEPGLQRSKQWLNLLWRCCGLLDDTDEVEAGPSVDVVLLVGKDERLGGHHLQVGFPRLNPIVCRNLKKNERKKSRVFEREKKESQETTYAQQISVLQGIHSEFFMGLVSH